VGLNTGPLWVKFQNGTIFHLNSKDLDPSNDKTKDIILFMNQAQKWIVKDSEGKIWGPFIYDKLIKQIENSYYTGEELVATYPGGAWIKMSKHPEFYDKLLESLSNDYKTEVKRQISKESIDDETKSGVEAEQASGRAFTAEQDLEIEARAKNLQKPLKSQNKIAEDLAPPVIELKNIKEHIQNETWKRSKLPLTLIILAAGAVAAALLISPKEVKGKGHLLSPRAGQPAITEARAAEKIKKSLQNFQRDTYSGYVAAENDLVEAIEGSPKNSTAMQILCLTYRELWPYVFQDSQDLSALSKVIYQVKSVDLSGVEAGICEIVGALLNDKTEQAQHLTDSWLQLQPSISVLYDIKGELYLLNKDFMTATPYFEKASDLWPQWQKLYIRQARAMTQKSLYPQALEFYRRVLAVVPSHSIAKIEMGLLELSLFQHYNRASELITSGLDGDQLPGYVQSRGLMGLADIAIQKGDKQASIAFAKKAYSVNPSNTEAKKKLIAWAGMKEFQKISVQSSELIFSCEQFLRAGDFISAQAECKNAFQKDPAKGVAALKASLALWQLNQSNEAIQWAQKAIQADSKLVEAYVTLSDFYSQRYDFDSAAKVLQSAYALMPKKYEILRGFALIELRRKDFKGAEAYAERALKVYDADSETFLIMGEAKIALGKFTEAQNFVGRAIEVDSTNADAQSLYAKVIVGIQGANAGITYLNDLITNYPRENKYRMALAEVYIQNDNYQSAEGILRQIISIETENKKAIITLGKVLRSLGRSNEALEQFFIAGVKDPNDAHPIFLAGELYFQTGKYAEAAQQFLQVLRQNPRFPLAHFQRGRSLLQLGQAKEALDESRLEQALNPNLSEGFILSAEANYALKQFSQCSSDFQKAVAKNPQGSEIYVKMARCNRRAGSLDAALSLLREAEAKESGNPNVYKELGAIYQTKAMPDEALKAYDRYLALLPNASDRGQVEEQMHKIESGNITLSPETF
jgi:tetratricopeptide (TPR) repeat protein